MEFVCIVFGFALFHIGLLLICKLCAAILPAEKMNPDYEFYVPK